MKIRFGLKNKYLFDFVLKLLSYNTGASQKTTSSLKAYYLVSSTPPDEQHCHFVDLNNCNDLTLIDWKHKIVRWAQEVLNVVREFKATGIDEVGGDGWKQKATNLVKTSFYDQVQTAQPEDLQFEIFGWVGERLKHLYEGDGVRLRGCVRPHWGTSAQEGKHVEEIRTEGKALMEKERFKPSPQDNCLTLLWETKLCQRSRQKERSCSQETFVLKNFKIRTIPYPGGRIIQTRLQVSRTQF